MIGLELTHLILTIKRRILLILLISSVCTIIASIVSFFILTPLYEASATLYVIKQKTDSEKDVTYEELMTNQKLVKDYREIIKSKLITNTVIEELDLQHTTSLQLSNSISVKSINDTSVLEITVIDANPERAQKLTNKICQVFIDKAAALLNINNISIVDVAELPTAPISPNPFRIISLTFMISFIISFGLFYFLELVNETIKSSEDIESILGLNVLGTIPLFNMK